MPPKMRPSARRLNVRNNSAAVAHEALAQLRADKELCEARVRLAKPRPAVTSWKVTYEMPDNFRGAQISTVADADLTEFLMEFIGPRFFTIQGRPFPNRSRVLRIEAV